jgi:hypothetical protein
MGQFSSYLQNKWLNHILKEGTANFSPPAVVALALHTGDPGVTGANNECANANNYARKSCKAQFATLAATRIISNDADIVMNMASGSWGTVTHWTLWDTSTYGGGNCLAVGSFSAGKAVAANQTPKVLVGEIDISVPASNGMTNYLANEMLDHTFLQSDAGFTSPATLYVALGVNTSPFLDTGVWTYEVSDSGTAYVRQAVDWTVSTNTATNTGAILFPIATASLGTVGQWALADGNTKGANNMLLYGDWAGVLIAEDDQVNIPAGDLDITLT